MTVLLTHTCSHTDTHYIFRLSCCSQLLMTLNIYVHTCINKYTAAFHHHGLPSLNLLLFSSRTLGNISFQRERDWEKTAHLRQTGKRPTPPWHEKPWGDLTTWLQALDPSIHPPFSPPPPPALQKAAGFIKELCQETWESTTKRRMFVFTSVSELKQKQTHTHTNT